MPARFLFVMSALILCPTVCMSSDDDELLKQVRVGHRSARQAIRQLSCVYLVRETLPSEKILASGKYLRSADVVLIKDGNEGIGTRDMLIRDGQCKRVGRVWNDGKVEYFATLQSDVQFFAWGDVWQRMLIDHSSPDGDRCNYDMVLDRIAKNARLKRDRISGHDCVQIEVEEKNKLGHTKVLKIWHDVKCNYLIRKLESYDQSSPNDRNIAEVTEFQEVTPGVMLPVKCRVDSYRADQLAKRHEAALTDVQINQPIADSAMALPSIPKGTEYQDYVRGTLGKIGPDWKPIGADTAMQNHVVAPSSDTPAGSGRQTVSEPWTLNDYLLYGSIAVFVVCGAFLLLRRIRAARANGRNNNS